MFGGHGHDALKVDVNDIYRRIEPAARLEQEELAALEKALAEQQTELQRLTTRLNAQQQDADTRIHLDEILNNSTMRFVAKKAQQEIDALVKPSLLGSRSTFSTYVDNAGDNINRSWEDLQQSYTGIMKDYIKQQVLEKNSSIMKVKITIQYYQQMTINFLQATMQAHSVQPEQIEAEMQDLVTEIPLAISVEAKKYRPDLDKHLQRLAKEKKITEEDKRNMVDLIKILGEENQSFAKLEEKITEFRNKIASANNRSLYAQMPDIEAARQDLFPVNIAGDKKKKLIDYDQYQANLKIVRQQEEAGLAGNKAMQNLDNLLPVMMGIRRPAHDDDEFITELKKLPALVEADIQGIIKLTKIFSDSRQQNEKSQLENSDSYIKSLRQIESAEHKNDSELRDAVKKFVNTAPVPAAEDRIHQALRASIQKEFALQEEVKFEEVSQQISAILNQEANVKEKKAAILDAHLLQILRYQMELTHKIYTRSKKRGFLKNRLHVMHHKDEGGEQGIIMGFMQQLRNPNIKTSQQGLQIINHLFDAKPGGLHKNSFVSQLMAVLFSEGNPKGLFRWEANQALVVSENYSKSDIKGVVADKLIGNSRWNEETKIVVLNQVSAYLQVLLAKVYQQSDKLEQSSSSSPPENK